jgi:hypothetical protein
MILPKLEFDWYFHLNREILRGIRDILRGILDSHTMIEKELFENLEI